MGGLLLANSAAFIEDIPFEAIEKENHNLTFSQVVDQAFHASAMNCFGAVGLYAVVLIFCLIQVFFNVKVSQLNKN